MDKELMEENQQPLSYDEWKQTCAVSFQDNYNKAFERLHGSNPEKDFEVMLKSEYQEYLNDLNGNWLNKG